MAHKFAKRHYEAIAEAMQEVKPVYSETYPAATSQWARTVKELADVFARDNGNFNRGRFERACEPGANVRARS